MAAGQRRLAEIGGEIRLRRDRVAGGVADQRIFDAGRHRARTQNRADAVRTFGRVAQAAVRVLRRIFEQHHVARLRAALDRGPLAALRAQRFDHRVDVRIGHRGDVLGDVQLGHVDRADFGQHFELGRVLDLSVGRLTGGVDLGRHRRTQVFLADRFVERVADQFRNGFAANLRAEALFDHLGRDLAGAEALQAHAARDFGQARLDLRFVLLGGNAHSELALEFAQVFDGDLHIGT